MTDEELAAIRERADAATVGEWSWHHHDGVSHGMTADGADAISAASYDDWFGAFIVMKEADAAFIAHARRDVPALVAEVERLRATIRRAADEARNVLPDLDDDQATAVEQFAALLLR